MSASTASTKTNNETLEKIAVMGQESEKKAAKWVMEEGKEQERAENKKENDELNKLDMRKRSLFSYTDEIIAATRRRMQEFDKPQGFFWGVFKTKEGKGIEIQYRRPDGKIFARGMMVSLSPNHDINWIIRTIHKALDEMELFDKQLHPELYADTTSEPKIII